MPVTSQAAPKNVLVIVHDFPPLGGGWVIRALKFVKHLESFGWRPVVLTVDPAFYPPALLDQSLLDEIPVSTPMYRTRTSIGPYQLQIPSQKTETSSVRGNGNHLRQILEALIPENLRVIQDYGFFWLPHAWSEACRIIQRESIDLIFTTSPPHNVHLLGWALKKRFRLPWVADFRDGWMQFEMFVASSAVRRAFDRRCERLILRNADRIICTTPRTVEDFCRDYPDIRQKIHTIYNGFDPADFENRDTGPPQKREFTIAYVGSLSLKPRRTPEILLRAVQSLASKNPAFREKARLEFVGLVYDVPLEQMLQEYKVASMCRIVGVVSHKTAIDHMRAADVLVLLINFDQKFGNDSILSGKFGEYVAAQKPLLAIVPEGEASNLVRDHNLGLVAAPDDQAGIEAAIETLFSEWQAGTLCPPPSEKLVNQFNRYDQTRSLARIFSSL
ncbi:MAG: glycosyltransferase [Acidobacteria bacterium]|nr:glycosyltransferase [Acidobacteriota bacterium]